ncbi:cupredoxin domain-containing protein [Niveispirillum irakense]|uniref:cupredoxin domain-containing protein n=1 Tax=Niveispirillum irakense TaxID=34011 RepID=UPI00040F073A|nr:hypothetical protein [Niveispirillum irakense]
MSLFTRGLTAAMLLAFAPTAQAQHHDHANHHSPADATAAGQPGKADTATRTLDVTLGEHFIDPGTIRVAPGETVRFRVTNKGEFLHSFVIADTKTHGDRQAMMGMMLDHGMITETAVNPDQMKMDHGDGHGMNHDHHDLLLVAPGKSAELVWTFPQGGDIVIACDMPGHYEAGMAASLTITR